MLTAWQMLAEAACAGPMVGLRHYRPPQQPPGQALGGTLVLPVPDGLRRVWSEVADSARRQIRDLSKPPRQQS